MLPFREEGEMARGGFCGEESWMKRRWFFFGGKQRHVALSIRDWARGATVGENMDGRRRESGETWDRGRNTSFLSLWKSTKVFERIEHCLWESFLLIFMDEKTLKV